MLVSTAGRRSSSVTASEAALIVRRVEMQGFTVHASTRLDLPARGVVLVTGPNGAGKSSILEAVAWGLWGKTLRGADPTPSSGRCEVQVLTSDRAVYRARASGKSELSWCRAGEEAVAYESTTKAQDALDAEVGTLDLWRRSCVFSSADAAHFTLATDAERKRLLESVLGLDRFDAALEACRLDLRTATVAHASADRDLAVEVARQEEAGRRVAACEARLDALEDPGDLEQLLERRTVDLRALGAGCRGQVAELTRRWADAARKEGEVRGLLRSAEERARTLADGRCPTCEQPVQVVDLDRFNDAVTRARSLLTDVCQQSTAIRAERDEAEEELRELESRTRAADMGLGRARGAAEARMTVETDLRGAQDALGARAAKVVELTLKVASLSAEVTKLEACERVLGMRGVRAHILGRALDGLAAAANGWLDRLAGGGLSVRLSPYTERRSGAMSEAISIEVDGAGGGRGYRGASGGERRRIDVALMLALADVAQAARGSQEGSTLWLDEVLDALDEQGATAVASVLEDLAQSRCVVVITHSQHLKDRLRTAVHVRAEGGRLVHG